MKPNSWVIAHRGASGYLPEHTLEAKALAHGLGADYIEQDVVATRDSALVVLHDTFLDDVTDVARVFPERAREDGRHYVVDFDLAEVRALRVIERRRQGSTELLFPQRFRSEAPRFRVPTLAEEIELIRELNRTTGREAGIYPEIKEPRWHREHGIDLAKLVLQELDRYGYRRKTDAAYVQCFDSLELQRIRSELETQLPLVQLLPASDDPSMTQETLSLVAGYAAGVGVPFELLIEGTARGPRATALAGRIRAAGLAIHAYTLRKDKLPEWADSFEQLLRVLLVDLEIDGIFSDHPDIAIRVRDGG